MTRQVAFLRGINLGARRRVSMVELRELLTDLGYGDVRTHLQSGNVVLDSEEPPGRLARKLEERIRETLEIDVEVVVRTRDELAGVIERDPFGELADDPKRYQVSFLSAEPDPQVTRDLAAANVAPERLSVSGREIYAWHPNGLQRSRLAGLLTDRRLGVTATARNWNTITKLLTVADR
jgi:uncharacterized protein (DUF1697 family)